LLGGVIMIFFLLGLGTRDGTNNCKYIHCPKNFMNDIWSLVGWWGVGKAKTWRFFGVLLSHIFSIMFKVVFTMCSQFVLGVFFTFFSYALPNFHLFCSHSSHVLTHFLCPIFLMLFLKFPQLLIMFPIFNNLCWKSYYSLDNWAKMERLVCKLYFRCVQTLKISFLSCEGASLETCFLWRSNQEGPS
jgi:hypothetical protein